MKAELKKEWAKVVKVYGRVELAQRSILKLHNEVGRFPFFKKRVILYIVVEWTPIFLGNVNGLPKQSMPRITSLMHWIMLLIS